MTITYRTAGAWGAGKGSNLTPAEVDDNFFTLKGMVDDALTNPTPPVEIVNFEVSGTQFFVHMGDGAVFGPLPLPVAAFRFEEEWQPTHAYVVLDVFTVANSGMYLVLLNHTSGATFDPNILVGGEPALQKLIGAVDEVAYDLALCYPDKVAPSPAPSERVLLLQFVATQGLTMPADLDGSVAFLGAPATENDVVLTIEKGNVSIGTITFSPGDELASPYGQYGTFVFPAEINLLPNEWLSIYAPLTTDATAARLSVSLALQRS